MNHLDFALKIFLLSKDSGKVLFIRFIKSFSALPLSIIFAKVCQEISVYWNFKSCKNEILLCNNLI